MTSTGPVMDREVPRDVVDRARTGVDPGEEVQPRERGNEHVEGVDLVAGAVERRRVGAGCARQIVDHGHVSGLAARLAFGFRHGHPPNESSFRDQDGVSKQCHLARRSRSGLRRSLAGDEASVGGRMPDSTFSAPEDQTEHGGRSSGINGKEFRPRQLPTSNDRLPRRMPRTSRVQSAAAFAPDTLGVGS